MAAHRRLYCGSFTSVTIIQPSVVWYEPAGTLSARGAPPSRICSATLWPSKAEVDWQRLTSIQRPVPTVARANSVVAMAWKA